jgi:hypothetical protein
VHAAGYFSSHLTPPFPRDIFELSYLEVFSVPMIDTFLSADVKNFRTTPNSVWWNSLSQYLRSVQFLSFVTLKTTW